MERSLSLLQGYRKINKLYLKLFKTFVSTEDIFTVVSMGIKVGTNIFVVLNISSDLISQISHTQSILNLKLETKNIIIR